MNAASIDIKDMLEAGGLDLVFKTNLFIGRESSKPGNKVTIYDTPSFPPDLTLDPDERYYNSSIQVKIRYADYDDGMEFARSILESLHGRAHETWNGAFYMVIIATGEPAPLDWDSHGQPSFIINFNLKRR